MTTKEYLEIYKKCPDPNNDDHDHYDGEKEDYIKLINFNKKLIEEYPFLLPRNLWTDKISKDYDYTYTLLDDMPDGWRVSFGDQMMEELKSAILEDGEIEYWDENGQEMNFFRITQIKEKYGGLRFYTNFTSDRISAVIYKYEEISYGICIYCGEPATRITRGWIEPVCNNCLKQHWKIAENEFSLYSDAIEEI